MTTTFALLCERCGLSSREAAGFLAVRDDTIKSWSSGRRTAPDGAIAQLRTLYAKIERAAGEAEALLAKLTAEQGSEPEVVELGLSRDDAEAHALGWPCVGAHAAALGLAKARLKIPVKIVPRGSTEATKRAAGVNANGT